MLDQFDQPLVFRPLFMERVWGGRRLAELYGKRLPPAVRVGESWEIADRAEAQSVVATGPFAGETLHALWTEHRGQIFGEVPETNRFPILLKLLDAQDKLSIQVHPPAQTTAEQSAEPKTEFWYIADATPAAEIYVGFKQPTTRVQIQQALDAGTMADHVHALPVRAGDAMFLPSGRIHAIGAGNVIVEIQENSDTTYRLFDWNRPGTDGKPRELHIEQALRCIDFDDAQPDLVHPNGETLVRHPSFQVDRWELRGRRTVSPRGQFSIVGCLSGEVHCAGVSLTAGNFALVPANSRNRDLEPRRERTTLLRVTLPHELHAADS